MKNFLDIIKNFDSLHSWILLVNSRRWKSILKLWLFRYILLIRNSCAMRCATGICNRSYIMYIKNPNGCLNQSSTIQCYKSRLLTILSSFTDEIQFLGVVRTCDLKKEIEQGVPIINRLIWVKKRINKKIRPMFFSCNANYYSWIKILSCRVDA